MNSENNRVIESSVVDTMTFAVNSGKKQKALKIDVSRLFSYLWSHMGSNHGPPDYESGALTS